MADTNIGATLSAVAQAGARSSFEIQFNNLQRTLINRYNEQVDKINDSSTTDHEVARLKKESQKLVEALPVIEQYRIGNQNNYGQLERILEDLTSLRSLISDDNTVTADEVTAFTELRDEIADRVNNLYLLVHPDINDGNATQRFKDGLDEFKALTPVEGTLDGDNAGLSDSLDSFINNATVATTVTSNTITTALDLEFKVQAEFSNVDANLLELTFEEQQRRNQEIDDLKVDLGNTLRAISLSFEINSELATQLSTRLRAQVPEPGSVLNLFT
ncbi:MAG: hypothetical protein F6K19_47730 [Cyanothece sp. SIO1E1]|nr:hypothetical protein [Cyanothece sp. SIO1E1]